MRKIIKYGGLIILLLFGIPYAASVILSGGFQYISFEIQAALTPNRMIEQYNCGGETELKIVQLTRAIPGNYLETTLPPSLTRFDILEFQTPTITLSLDDPSMSSWQFSPQYPLYRKKVDACLQLASKSDSAFLQLSRVIAQ